MASAFYGREKFIKKKIVIWDADKAGTDKESLDGDASPLSPAVRPSMEKGSPAAKSFAPTNTTEEVSPSAKMKRALSAPLAATRRTKKIGLPAGTEWNFRIRWPGAPIYPPTVPGILSPVYIPPLISTVRG